MAERFRRVVRLTVNTVLDFMFTSGEHPVMAITPTELQTRAGISKGYASDLLAGKKTPSPTTALRIMRMTGLKLGPIANLSDDQIAVLEAMHG